MNRMSDVGKLISDFVNSWHSIITSKDYGLKKCTSYLTILHCAASRRKGRCTNDLRSVP